MKKLLTTLSVFVFIHSFGQTIHSDSQVMTENQKNQDIVVINQLWKDYLASSPDSLYNNPYWNEADKKKHKSYDLLRSEGYMNIYSLGKYGELKNLVLSIKPLDDKYYDIHSMYYWGDFEGYPMVLCTTHVLAFKDTHGRFVLGNWLNYYSKDWKTYREGIITFHYQVYNKSKKKIKKAVKFLAFMKSEFDVNVDSLDIYISNGWKETQRLKGFGYDYGETAISDYTDKGASTDLDNCIIYSNLSEGEFYQHEMMRFVIARYPGVHRLLSDGLSEYYSDDSELRGISHKEHFKHLDDFLSSRKEIDLKNFDSFDSGNLTEKNYLIGMVLVKMIEDKCGHEKLLKALNIVHTDEDLILFLDMEMGIKPDEINSVLRSEITRFASNGFDSKSL